MSDSQNFSIDSFENLISLFNQSTLAAESIMKHVLHAVGKEIELSQIKAKIPSHSLKNMIQLSDRIIEMELFDFQDSIDVDYIEDLEPNRPQVENWRRIHANVKVNQIMLIEKKKNKKKKIQSKFFNPSVPLNQSQLSNNQSPKSPRSQHRSSFDASSPFEQSQISVGMEILTSYSHKEVEEEENQEQQQSIWANDEYKYEFVDMSVPTELDPVDEQLRLQYLFEIEKRAERDKVLEQREEQHQSEMKMLRNISLSKNKVTFDYDGRLLVVEKMKKKKLGVINPKMQIEYGETEFNGQLQKEIVESDKEEKEEEQKKIQKRKPGLKRFNMIVNQKTQKDPALEIIKQQETNLNQLYLDQFHVKPGVSLQLGANFKIMPKSTSASQLPYTVQAKMNKYLGENDSVQLKLTKNEYDQIIQKNGSISSLYSGQYNKRGSEIMKDQSKIEISNYSKKINKFKQKKHIQSAQSQGLEDSMISEGTVKVNNIGKVYELFMHDDKSTSQLEDEDLLEVQLNEEVKELDKARQRLTKNQSSIFPVIQAQLENKQQQQIQQVTSKKSKEKQIQWGDNPPLKEDISLPMLPAQNFYRHLNYQKSKHPNVLQSESAAGSMISLSMISGISKTSQSQLNTSKQSKLIRDRGNSEAIESLSKHKYLAAPKVGKFLGYGVNMKYKV